MLVLNLFLSHGPSIFEKIDQYNGESEKLQQWLQLTAIYFSDRFVGARKRAASVQATQLIYQRLI